MAWWLLSALKFFPITVKDKRFCRFLDDFFIIIQGEKFRCVEMEFDKIDTSAKKSSPSSPKSPKSDFVVDDDDGVVGAFVVVVFVVLGSIL
jgi:hypothetical protein